MSALTLQQLRLLSYIRAYIAEHGVSPTVRQAATDMGLSGIGNISRMLKCLEERGAIRRTRYRERGIEVIDEDPFHGLTTTAIVAELERRGWFSLPGRA